MRFRFAPSPTGHLHVGGARTAILNWLLARHHGGAFVLRVEDTDQDRNVAGAESEILDDLRWLGLDWDEGPDVGGPFGPYRQSEREQVYQEHVRRLLDAGRAYPCTCLPAQEAYGQTRARCECAGRVGERPAPGASLRLLAPQDREIAVRDVVRGEIAFPPGSVEDFVLLRSDGRPTYNFAAAVDDAAMRITHVIRGADHLANTPKQVLLYEAFGWQAPEFAHIPLILGPDRQKLSKRHGATSVAEHRRHGYLPEALVNYLSLLSWSSPSGEEFLPRERLVEEVDLARVGASDAVFDREKLRWLSGRYIQQLPLDQLAARLGDYVDRERFPGVGDRLDAVAVVVRERISTLAEVNEQLPLFAGPSSDGQWEARAAVMADLEARRVLEAVARRLDGLSDWDEQAIAGAVRGAGAELGVRGRALFHPVRAALSGEEQGPDLAKIALVLGRERTLSLLRVPARAV